MRIRKAGIDGECLIINIKAIYNNLTTMARKHKRASITWMFTVIYFYRESFPPAFLWTIDENGLFNMSRAAVRISTTKLPRA